MELIRASIDGDVVRVVSLLNSGAYISTVGGLVCYCQCDECIICMVKYTLYTMLYTCTCRAYANCGHVLYSGQDVVQCTSIVGAVASAAVSSDGSYSH